MANDFDSPEVLCSVVSEIEAGAIVNVLAEHGIQAMAVGGYTSGFKAEAPGVVKVVVKRGELALARETMAEIDRQTQAEGEVDDATDRE